MFAVMVVVVVMWLIIQVAKGSGATGSSPTQRGYQKLLSNGLPARGILLSVANRSYGSVGVGMFKFQQRTVTIDVEVGGQAPYEVMVNALIPLNLVRDVLPGATVELRVDPNDPSNIAIVGPGVGFNAATLMTQGQINQGAA